MRNCLFLVKNGVPYDVAFSLPPEDVLAYTIIFGEIDGGEFDFNALAWKESK